jgi:hypothetical protein
MSTYLSLEIPGGKNSLEFFPHFSAFAASLKNIFTVSFE